jgi:tetratricopeptide (TPR) repeat protein
MNPKKRVEKEPAKPATFMPESNLSNAHAKALAKAVSLHLEGKAKEALKELDNVVNGGADSPEVHSARGHLQYELEFYDEAVQSYSRLLALDSRHQNGNFNLAVCLEKLGRWEHAAQQFEKALDADPQRLEAWLGLGICRLHSEKAEQALDAFERCLTRDPDHETARFGKAVALQYLWRFDESAELYRGILEKNPNSEESLVNLITIGMARKDEKMIRDYSERLLVIRPFSQAALEGLATCAFSANDYEAAARCCAKLVEFTPNHFERWFNLGVAYQKLGRLEQAAQAYGEAVRVRPEA